MQHNVPITNGKGNKELADGTYTVTSSTIGYDDIHQLRQLNKR